ncbi:branched-chain amino acid ABC transporter permease [Ruixingdingia sedimenti]|uniref:Branched-chain amino acid ABC transporter permease n=1 Tax=Ruixingdingia sedimenti TaxID=3073604 RepID=A0ABU1F9G2_9RHOB|nr:branched-chain amino acid ABC transporter permease [Xinfangfangia sp. LG-4]MDR5653258.1 branched-chain amino acid ABC transporter permease [Xinfangfangia sp. LG-4]
MQGLPQILINALAIGSSYTLVAVGFTLIFGVLRVVYLAHAAVLAASAYAGYLALSMTGSVVVALGLGIVTGGVLGLIVEFVAIRPVRGQDHLIPMVTTISAAIIIEELLRLTVERGQPISYPDTFGSTVIRLNVFGTTPYFTLSQALIVVMAVVLVLVLTWIVRRTWAGRAIRAVADSEDIAALLGVRVNVVSASTVALASMLAGAGGVLIAMSVTAIDPHFAAPLQFKALAIALFAGMGSIPGAVIGGFLLGFIEAFAVGYLDPSYRDLFAFLVMIAILMVWPQGLLGRKVAQRV